MRGHSAIEVLKACLVRYGCVHGSCDVAPPPPFGSAKNILSLLVVDNEQLAVSYLNVDKVEVYDLRTIDADGRVTPVLTLKPSSGTVLGRGHLSLEFVRRGPPGRTVTHLVAGGRGGVFRVWRFFPERATELAPYLQVTREEKRSQENRREDRRGVCI